MNIHEQSDALNMLRFNYGSPGQASGYLMTYRESAHRESTAVKIGQFLEAIRQIGSYWSTFSKRSWQGQISN